MKPRPFLVVFLSVLGLAAAPPGSSLVSPSADATQAEIEALFTTYLRLHAAKDMKAWQGLFLPEAIAVRTGSDGVVNIYPIAELARSIAETARTLDSQHETFEDTRIETYGDTAVYSTRWKLFHNQQFVRQGRAFFSLIKKDGRWRIASLVWYRD